MGKTRRQVKNDLRFLRQKSAVFVFLSRKAYEVIDGLKLGMLIAGDCPAGREPGERWQIKPGCMECECKWNGYWCYG